MDNNKEEATQSPVSEEWEKEFDSRFSEIFKNIKVTPRQSEEYDTAMILQKYYQDTGERIKDFIRKLLSGNKE